MGSYLVFVVAAAISVPSGLSPRMAPAVGEQPVMLLRAEGVQVFECRPLAIEADRFAWSFVAPEATLYDGGRATARHGGGQSWEAIGDPSSVTGSVRAIQDGGPNNIPWLSYRALPAGESGLFAGVTSIQRVNTVGGAAPDGGCDATHVGDQVRVAFNADYYFYKRQ
jgi:hypothetical protein